MEYRPLGKTGLQVSRLCFGTLTLGPLQANLPLEQGAMLLQEAYCRGINFWDTAELYDNYHYLRLALGKINDVPVIVTKTYAFDRSQARASLEKARRELDLDVIPIFMLHEQESPLTLMGHREALDFFLECREKGLIKAVGISTHTLAAVNAAAEVEGIDVIHTIVNFKGLGIKDGALEEMLAALRRAHARGIGIYAMKVLGGGHLIPEAEKAIRFALDLEILDSMAIGISSLAELEVNLHYFEGRKPPAHLLRQVAQKKRRLKVEEWCSGCGTCLQHCPQEAITLSSADGQLRATVENSRCILCGYCGAHCPEFCLKIF